MSTMTKENKFPPQIKYIVGNEGAERYSFYGMRSILTVFMISQLLMSEGQATATYHLFVAACYLLTILGGYISDRYWGKYETIIRFSIVYCLGHLALALFESKIGLYWGLGLIALGSGGVKACASAHVGDQFNTKNDHLLPKVFSLWYWMINCGAVLSSWITPWTLKMFGSRIAFGIPGILMAMATVIFWMGKKHYHVVPPSGKDSNSILAIVISAFKNNSKRTKGQSFLDGATLDHPVDKVEGAKSFFDVTKVFLWVSAFWALYDQQGSSWVIQAEKMDLNFLGLQILPSQVQAWNPLLILIFIPVFTKLIYPFIEKMGFNFTPLRRMTAGMFITGLSFATIGWAEYRLNSGIQVNIIWQIIAYIFLTVGEILVSITGLEFAYTQSPRYMKSTIMSMFFLTIFIGNMFTSWIASINQFEGAAFFYFFAIIMFVVSILFAWVAKGYKNRNYLEGI